MIDRFSFISPAGCWYNQRTVKIDGTRKDEPIYARLYYSHDIRSLIRDAGIEIEAILGGWNSVPVSPEPGKMVIVAKKPADLYQMIGT